MVLGNMHAALIVWANKMKQEIVMMTMMMMMMRARRYGVETYPDGSEYSGEFSRSMRHGLGRYTHFSGRTYIGEWMNGQRHGKAWERVRIKMASGLIIREFLVEYEKEEEISRKLLTNKSVSPCILLVWML